MRALVLAASFPQSPIHGIIGNNVLGGQASLAAGGIILMILPLANMNFVFPGPIIRVVVGLVIFGLGVAKGIRIARAVMVSSC